jgi:hypothetical protein
MFKVTEPFQAIKELMPPYRDQPGRKLPRRQLTHLV